MTTADVLDPARANALAVTLGLEHRFTPGEALPPFFHQAYFWEPVPAEGLGQDGHPAVGHGLIPDMGLPRRMWAGGRLAFHAPLFAGETGEKRSVVEKAEEKEGRTGPLAFVTLRHEISQSGVLKVTEWQDIVYRAADAPSGKPRPAPEDASAEARLFSTTELFRYSALTFNGHRIHYDADYAREVEGYDGLVVHGPLLAQILMLKAERELGPLSAFRFRATAPVIQGQSALFCRDGSSLWVRGEDGQLCMEAEAQPA